MGAKMDQSIVNWLLAGFGALIGFLLNAVWQAVKDLQRSDKDIAAKVADIEVLVAGDYVKKNEFQDNIKALFAKLDKIEDKIDRKADK
jgi:CHASE3 domain sensor protein